MVRAAYVAAGALMLVALSTSVRAQTTGIAACDDFLKKIRSVRDLESAGRPEGRIPGLARADAQGLGGRCQDAGQGEPRGVLQAECGANEGGTVELRLRLLG